MSDKNAAQNARYHTRRAMGVCSLCPSPLHALKDGRQPWACFRCRLKMARFQRARRARHSQGHAFMVFAKDGRARAVEVTINTVPETIDRLRAEGFAPPNISGTVHLPDMPLCGEAQSPRVSTE